jgi:preprotein translocase SecF subunit
MGHEHPRSCRRSSRPNEYIIRVEKSSPITAARREQIRRGWRSACRARPGAARSATSASRRAAITSSSSSTTARSTPSRVAELLRDAGANVRGDAALQMPARATITAGRCRSWASATRSSVTAPLVGPDGVGAEGQLSASVWVSPKAGAELRYAALRAVAYSIVFIMIYVAFRFDLRFAPGGILALFHDSLVTLGFFVITRKEVTISTVAAILTVVGYSMNDTIIVYDRIRENLAKRRVAPAARRDQRR